MVIVNNPNDLYRRVEGSVLILDGKSDEVVVEDEKLLNYLGEIRKGFDIPVDMVLLYLNGFIDDISSIYFVELNILDIDKNDERFRDVMINDGRDRVERISDFMKTWAEFKRIKEGFYHRVIMKNPNDKILNDFKTVLNRVKWFKSGDALSEYGDSINSFLEHDNSLIGTEVVYNHCLQGGSDEELAVSNSYVSTSYNIGRMWRENPDDSKGVVAIFNPFVNKIFIWKYD